MKRKEKNGEHMNVLFITAAVLLMEQKSLAVENRHFKTVEPGDDPDFRVAV